jgi:uncharacterized protein YggE
MAASTPFRPAEIFASLESRHPNSVERQSSVPDKRSITVSGTGEIEIPPDRIYLSVSVVSSKNSVEEARSSVQRRCDYIRQVLRNHGFRENTYETSTGVKRDPRAWTIRTEFSLTFMDAAVCEKIENTLTEKLQTGVVVSNPSFSHSQQCIQSGQQQVCLQAVQNARSKAVLIARALKEEVGQAISVHEESMEEFQREENGRESHQVNTQRQMKMFTRVFQATVNIVFELKPLKSRRVGRKL